MCAADKVHNGSSILADLRRTMDPDTVWSRFSAGREGTIRWYRAVYERLGDVGFDAPILAELRGCGGGAGALLDLNAAAGRRRPRPALRGYRRST